MYFQVNEPVSFDKQPNDYWSAKRLALTVAKKASCNDFEYLREYETGVEFTCLKSDFSFFTLSIFYSQQLKEKYMKELSATKEWSTFKAGYFYIILENINSDHTNIPEDYTDFSGELITPLKIKSSDMGTIAVERI
ncbi:MAG: hypothetical protein WAX77_00345 [Methylococcaceae bacterium]